MKLDLQMAIYLYKEIYALPNGGYTITSTADKLAEFIHKQTKNLEPPEEAPTRQLTTPTPNDDPIPF
jgi:hypothetical protein